MGWGSRLFFSIFFSFSFHLFQSITLPSLIAFNERSTTCHLKKIKEVVGKTRAATGQGSVESSTRAEGGGLRE
jgi:hypothetical protein